MPKEQDRNLEFSSHLDENNSEENHLSEYKPSSSDDENDVCIQYKKSTLILSKDNKMKYKTSEK